MAGLDRWLLIKRGEWRPFLLSFVYFFCLIGSYMMLRPVRETLAVRSGEVEWLFSATFAVMLAIVPLFGFLVARFRKRVFLPLSYLFFIANLAGFAAWLSAAPDSIWAGRAFFVWLSAYNMFVVSVFWSLMVDVFSDEQARRLFGPIAAGGSLGGMAGPLVGILNVETLGMAGLIAVAAGLLGLALICQLALLPRVDGGARGGRPIGGSIWAGALAVFRDRYLLGIGAILVFLPLMNTLLYFTQAQLVESAFEYEADRLRWFASVDLATQVIALILQFVVTARLLRGIGAAWTLAIMPLVTLAGMAVLALAPNVMLLGVFQAMRRGGEYGLMKPARELLFTRVGEEAKYKAKNFIDTVVYRGGDMASGWIYRGLSQVLGLGIASIALLAVPAAALWAWLSYRVGRTFEADSRYTPPAAGSTISE